MIDRIRALFPRIISCIAWPQLLQDLEVATRLVSTSEDSDQLRLIYEARQAGRFQSGLLTYFLAAEAAGDRSFEAVASSIEADLEILEQFGLHDDARRAFGEKLQNDDTFETVRYEIAVAGVVVPLLDPRTAQLEVRLPDSDKNSDIAGSWNGRPTRVEVTTITENWPPPYDEEARAIVESANIPCGYSVNLNSPLTDQGEANRAKLLIERLHKAWKESPNQDVQLDQYRFRSEGNAFRCATAGTPFHYIEFIDQAEFRMAQGTAFTRATLSRSQESELKEEFPAPRGVKTVGDLPKDSRTHRDVPASKKAYDVIQWKLAQCVADSINLVVVGQTQPWNDSAISDAMLGGVFLSMRLGESSEGDVTSCDPRLHRTMTGPFADIATIPAERRHLIEGVVDEFRVVSAVLGFRIDSPYPLASLLQNANASVPLSDAQANALRLAAEERSRRVISQT